MFFFTVTLADRSSSALVDHIAALRNAFRAARRERPFAIEAIVILPDHLHAVLTLPTADADFSGRWRRIKGHFSRALLEAGISMARASNGDLSLWQRRFWEHTIRDENDFERHVDYIPFQPDQARPRSARARLAALFFPSLCPAGPASGGLGRNQ